MLARVSDDAPAPAPVPKAPVRAAAGAGRSEAVKNPWPFILLVVGLCVAGWFIASWMQQTSQIQDCVNSGRKNCGTPIDPALGR